MKEKEFLVYSNAQILIKIKTNKNKKTIKISKLTESVAKYLNLWRKDISAI